MNLAATSPVWLSFALAALLVLAAAEDAWRMRISNLTSGMILIGAVIAAVIVGPTLALWQNGAMLVGLLALGLPLFAAGKMGGGDVKLLAATGAWFNFDGGLLMVVCTLIAGGLLTLIILAARMFSWPEAMRSRVALLRRGSGIPYGIAIAIGGLIAIGWT